MSQHQQDMQELVEALLGGSVEEAARCARELLGKGIDPLEFFQKVYTPALHVIGDRFGRLEIFLPELVSSSKIAKVIADEIVLPAIPKERREQASKRGRVVIGTVNADLHNIGKNMVAMMLEVHGFEVIDIGVDVASREFIKRAVEVDADVVAVSALMTTSMEYMREIVELREGFGHKDRFAIIVGGAPVTEAFAREIGADAYGDSAVEAVEHCSALCRSRVEGRRMSGS